MRFTRWDQGSSTAISNEIVQELALWHCSQAGDHGIRLAEFIYEQNFPAIVGYQFSYDDLQPSEARNLRQALAFYSKRIDLELGVDKEAVAKSKFIASEELCQQTNEIFRLRRAGLMNLSPRTERILFYAQRKIASILGDIPSLPDLKFRFGPGATTQVARRMASSRAKLGEVPACSYELFPMAQAVLKMMPEWCRVFDEDYDPSVASTIPVEIHTGKVVFVPKSAKEFRTVMIEPSLNTMCQAGIGEYISERLRSVGVDIRDQTLNQRLAREGSRSGALATLDLSSASDTIASELVFDLLGADWYSLLARFRTGTAKLSGDEIRLEKFSSMGNGYTFPLETLLFYAIAYGNNLECGGSSRSVCSAYGDDLIVPSAYAEGLVRVLTDVGFIVNKEKSYWEGSFRESCGKDYFSGFDIRPVYLKDRLFCYDLFRLYNHYTRWYNEELATYILSFIDPSIRIFGPDGYGDGHLLGEWVPVKKRKHLQNGYCGNIFETFSFRPISSRRVSRGDRALPTYSIYMSPEGTGSNEIFDPLRTYGGRSLVRYEKGNLHVALPGKGRCYRISIYTFVR